MPASLIALCFGNFIIGTGTLVVPGMLPALSEGLQVSVPVAGQLVSAFAFTVCLSAPLLAGATSRYDRRKLLVSMQLLYVVGHLAAAALSAFLPLLLVRVGTSFGAALFTAQAAATASRRISLPLDGVSPSRASTFARAHPLRSRASRPLLTCSLQDEAALRLRAAQLMVPAARTAGVHPASSWSPPAPRAARIPPGLLSLIILS